MHSSLRIYKMASSMRQIRKLGSNTNDFFMYTYNFLFIFEMIWKNTLINWIALTYVREFQSTNTKVHSIKSRNGVDLGFILLAQMLNKLGMSTLYMLLKISSFQLLFKDSALFVQRLGLKRSKRNNILNFIMRVSLLLFFIYYFLWFYKDFVLLYNPNRLEIMTFSKTHYSKKCFNLKTLNKFFIIKVYNENQN